MRIKFLLIIIFVFSVSAMFSKKLKEGAYRGVLTLHEKNAIELPFNFTIHIKAENQLSRFVTPMNALLWMKLFWKVTP